jgi:hypothetical protein
MGRQQWRPIIFLGSSIYKMQFADQRGFHCHGNWLQQRAKIPASEEAGYSNNLKYSHML